MGIRKNRKKEKLIEMKLERKNKLSIPYNEKALRRGKWIFKLFIKIIKIKRILNGGKINVVNDYRSDETPVIYAATHISRDDIERAYEWSNEHSILLCGTAEYLHGTLDGFMLEKNLVNYVDRDDKEDRLVAKKQMVRDLQNGANILWFPEGTWNISPNLLILPISYGIIQVALEANVPIIPIGIDYDIDKKIYHVNVGNKFNAKEYSDKLEAITALRDALATLKWKIYEKYSVIERKYIDDNYWSNYINRLAAEWEFTDYEREKRYIFKNKNHSTNEEVFNHIESITPTIENAFLFNKK